MLLVRTGFIGVGEQGLTNLLPALVQAENAKLVAVCDADVNKAQRAAHKFGVEHHYNDYREMIEKNKLDALVVACPPQVHYEISLYAMERNINVFIEKPPCVTTAQLEALIAMAKVKQVHTGVGLNFRFATPFQRLQDIISKPEFGKVVHVQITHTANKPKLPLWGLTSTVRSFLLAQTIHSIDMAMTFGQIIDDTTYFVKQVDGSMLITIQIAFRNGVTATILTGNMFPYFEFDLKVIGSESNIVSLNNMWHLCLEDGKKKVRFLDEGKRWKDLWNPSPLDSGYARSGYLGELEAFMQAIIDDRVFPASFESLIPTYRMIDMIDKPIYSKQNQQPVTV